MRLPFLAKWVFLGFTLRAVFAIVVILRMQHDREAGTLYYMDLPTLVVVHVLERIHPRLAHPMGGGPPLFLSWNTTGCLVWGLIFMSVGWLFTLVVKPIRRLR